MLYAIICYNDENITSGWSKAEDDAVMHRLIGVTQKIAAAGKLGPVARLQPTTQGKMLRKGKDGPVVIDGPYAETKEHLLGFYLVECADVDEAVDIAKQLQQANSGPSSYDIRPVMFFTPGGKPVERVEG
jgi:hypothetical protein